MRKKKFYFVVPVLAFVFLFCNCISVCADGTDEFEMTILDIMEEQRTSYSEDTEFYREAEAKGVSFDELLRQKAISTYYTREKLGTSAIVPYGIGNNGLCLYTNVPLIQQTKTFNCGPTAALQVLYSMGCQNQVTGQTNEDKISQLEKDCGTNKEDGTIVWKLTNTLNQYTTRADYRYILGSGMTMEDFQKKVETSLFYDVAPILHAKTQYLDYYNGHESGHYIAVCEVDNATGKIRVQDCNCNNKYYGQHTVPIEKAFRSINVESWRYLICMNY